MTISNTDINVLQALKKTWGGTVYTYGNQGGYINPRHKPTYRWELQARKVIPFLRAILPYLITKQKVVAAVLVLQSRYNIGKGKHRTISPDEERFREWMFLYIKELNKRGA